MKNNIDEKIRILKKQTGLINKIEKQKKEVETLEKKLTKSKEKLEALYKEFETSEQGEKDEK